MESTNYTINLNIYIIDHFSFVINIVSIGKIGISSILNNIILFSLTVVGGLFKCYFISTFTYTSIKPHGGSFEGRRLIVKKEL